MRESHGLKKKIEGRLVEPVVISRRCYNYWLECNASNRISKEGVSVQGIVCM